MRAIRIRPRKQPVSAAADERDQPGVRAGATGTRGAAIVGASGT
jgi:hypothetical protein